ncbi:MAG: Fpg/Nei family DNA glycosylase [Polyangiales bacterium]
MPELPEVEVARKNLQRWISGATITRVVAPRSRVVEGSTRALVGHSVRSIERRGKWLKITLDDERIVFSHFGMTGRWVKRPIDDPKERWERVRLDLQKPGSKGTRVYSARYVDPRMFGRFTVTREDLPGWLALGPDPLLDEIDPKALHARAAKSKRTIKEVLMDQSVIAGVGNIQATDALFLARVLPERVANTIELREMRAIVRAIHRSIERTLSLEEGPEITYVEDAGAPNPFIVYGRAGSECPRCGAVLVRTILGGRATVHCPKCQS